MAKVFEAAYEAGVMIRVSGPNVILSPPLVITTDDVNRIIEALDHGLTVAANA